MEALCFEKGAQPLYIQIKERLLAQIQQKKIAYGEKIPAEAALCKQYGVSRITVRQAVLELEQEGYVTRARGKGTVVSYQKKIEEFLTRIVSFTEEMEERGIVPGTRGAHMEQITAGPGLASVFGCPEGAPLFCLKRIRTGDGEPIVLFESYFPGRFPFPLDEGRYQGSVYALMRELGIPSPSRVTERFEAVPADEGQAKALGLAPGAPLLRRVRTSVSDRHGVLEYTVSHYRGDVYSYRVETFNQQKGASL